VISEQTIDVAKSAAAELRERGEQERAQAIEALIDAVRESMAPRRDQPATETEQVGDLVGATGPMLKKWVQEGRFSAYRAGKFVIPKELVEEYVRRAGPSLDLEEIPDEEAARLVAEGRKKH
jgi:hypothetical protein